MDRVRVRGRVMGRVRVRGGGTWSSRRRARSGGMVPVSAFWLRATIWVRVSVRVRDRVRVRVRVRVWVNDRVS